MTEEDKGVTEEQVAEAQEGSVDDATKLEVQPEGKNSTEVNLGRMREKYEGELAIKDRQINAYDMQLRAIQNQQQVIQNKIAEEDFLTSKDEDDVPTFGDLKKMYSDLDKKAEKIQSQIKRTMLIDKYPNYVEIITKYENEVPKAISNAIQKSGDLEAAIEACINTPGYIKDSANNSAMHPNAKRALDNVNKPKSPLSLSAAGSVSSNSKYLNMDRSQRRSLQDKFCRG